MDIIRICSRPSPKSLAGLLHRLGAHRHAISGQGSRARRRRVRHVRARRSHRLAYPSSRPDPDRHDGLRLGAQGRRLERGDPSRRRGLDYLTPRESAAQACGECNSAPSRRGRAIRRFAFTLPAGRLSGTKPAGACGGSPTCPGWAACSGSTSTASDRSAGGCTVHSPYSLSPN
jgi:hypothetical protein